MPPSTSKTLRMSYKIARGEQGVLTFEPYKSMLLPHWRFRTVPIAQESSSILWTKFLEYHEDCDFVGMDMARKFIQMGMTRAKRYANYKGGRKYIGQPKEEGKGYGRRGRQVLDKSQGHKGQEEKLRASNVFREVWERCMAHEGYVVLKEEFLAEQKEWERNGGPEVDEDAIKREAEGVKAEADEEVKLEQSDIKINTEHDDKSERKLKRRKVK